LVSHRLSNLKTFITKLCTMSLGRLTFRYYPQKEGNLWESLSLYHHLLSTYILYKINGGFRIDTLEWVIHKSMELNGFFNVMAGVRSLHTATNECDCCQCRKLYKEPKMILMQLIVHQSAYSYSQLDSKTPPLPACINKLMRRLDIWQRSRLGFKVDLFVKIIHI